VRRTRALFVQIFQAVPCTTLHTVEQRCARWLLMCADRTEDDTFELAQECLAEMSGVPDSTWTAVVGSLQQAGLINYRRDVITVLDRRGPRGGRVRMLPDRPRPLRKTAGVRLRLTAAPTPIKGRGPSSPPKHVRSWLWAAFLKRTR
jgi:Crp-like helix-turn-helix domain